tara:strand:+ start:399 stop:521 length:123 start_codon:yes stop_codon:yes gene_type:complete
MIKGTTEEYGMIVKKRHYEGDPLKVGMSQQLHGVFNFSFS